VNEDTFNIQIRKFLKKVGITSQREIEKTIRDAVESGALKGNEKLNVAVILQLPEVGINVTINDTIALE